MNYNMFFEINSNDDEYHNQIEIIRYLVTKIDIMQKEIDKLRLIVSEFQKLDTSTYFKLNETLEEMEYVTQKMSMMEIDYDELFFIINESHNPYDYSRKVFERFEGIKISYIIRILSTKMYDLEIEYNELQLLIDMNYKK